MFLNKKNIKSKKTLKLLRNIIILLFVLFIIGIGVFYIEDYYGSPRNAADALRELGSVGPIAVILLVILEVVVAPIPGWVVAIASGYAFGAILGTIYTYIGNVVGTTIAFLLSKRFGRPFVEHIVDKKKLDYYDDFFNRTGRPFLWLMFLFPIFPTDIVAFATGMSNIKLKDFIFIVSIAYIPNMLLLNYFGAVLYDSGFGEKTIIFGSVLLFILLLGAILFIHMKKRDNK